MKHTIITLIPVETDNNFIPQNDLFVSRMANWYYNHGYKASMNGNLLIIHGEYTDFTYCVALNDKIFQSDFPHPKKFELGQKIVQNIARMQIQRIIRSINAGV